MNPILVGLIVATVAEVAGLAYWLHFLQQQALVASFLALIAGEAVEWSLLAGLIYKTAATHQPKGGISGTLIKTALIIFSESLLWVCWVAAIPRLGFATSTLFLLLLMHLKHCSAVAVYTGRPLAADIVSASSIAATVLEVGGAAFFYQSWLFGYATSGVVVLGICITVEHYLQFRSAGILNPPGAPPVFS